MVPNITPIMENQMEEKMENEMETGINSFSVSDCVSCPYARDTANTAQAIPASP